MPRYDRYTKLAREMSGSVKRGDVSPRWSDDGKEMAYGWDGKTYVMDLATLAKKEGDLTAAPTVSTSGRRGQRRGPDRGRQFTEVFTVDGKMRAFYKDRNVWLSDGDGKNEKQVTTDGSVANRIKYGQASWVYGEELSVREAMWFSPDGKKLAYYRFDESKVPDYYLAMDQGKVQDTLDVEAYPKAGAPNPEVALFVYDLATGKSTRVDSSFGQAELGHYVYEIRWSPKGDELLFNRTNRKQNTMQFCAANPNTGACRVVVEEKQPDAWAENAPDISWLQDETHFIWVSERNGFRNFYMGNIDGSPLKPITQNKFEVVNVVKVDEKSGTLWYRARSGNNPYLVQLHRVGLDGKGDKRLTDPAFNHTSMVAPNGKFFVDIAETLEQPPTSTLRDGEGKQLALLAESDLSKFKELNLQRTERITFKAADGVTDLYGYIQKPSDFDPSKKYPLLVGMYAGPESGSGQERFMTPDPVTEFGFITAWFDGRGTSGRGKAFKDAVYKKLGIVEIDDQAAGVKYLRTRPYIDGNRVGAHGTSYGGYSSLMCLLRYPDVFQAAVSCSPVTAWYNYDSIYTERYMSLPDESDNKSGYDAGSAMQFAKDLKGRLMLFYGTADNNVHPANTLQLAQALSRAGKSFDMMVGTDMGHSAINGARQWEYFIDYLILNNKKDGIGFVYNQMKRKRLAAKR